ncbi:MAG TPA: hypothetical protein VLZ54_11885 [Arenibacter sp.]|nr:hypothetical protein [Arenibacter sp.]
MADNFLGRIPAKYVKVTAGVLVALALSEGFTSKAIVPVPGDVYTYGYGTTWVDGKPVKKGDTITPERALAVLYTQVEDQYASKLRQCITAPVYSYEFEGLLELAYNVGAETVCKTAKPGNPPNLIDLLNSGRYEEAGARISQYNCGPSGKPGIKIDKCAAGKMILPGLVKRRARERAKFEGHNVY